MRIVIDLDGTICELRKDSQDYADVCPIPNAVQKMNALRKAGHYLIIHTARHMKTCDGNAALVEKRIGKKTRDWLAKHKIPYDELVFGKPYAQLYIDDLALPFRGWDAITPTALDSERINVLIPMAGRGFRFTQAGFTVPKPLIKVRGKMMIEWAMRSFAFLPKKNIHHIFIVLKEHNKEKKMERALTRIFGAHTTVIELDGVTRGQAETCLAAKEHIQNYNRLFIFNCDTYSVTPNLMHDIKEHDPDGLLVCFHATDPRYSFVKLDAHGYVNETAEKKAISTHASNGMYYFKHGHYFVEAAETAIKSTELHNGEFYVAPLYNRLLTLGKKVRIHETKKNWVLGTPEELALFKKTYDGK